MAADSDPWRLPPRSRMARISIACDLKTFANKFNKPIDAAIYGAMAAGKYHVQASVYLRAVEKAKAFASQGRVISGGVDVQREWLGKFAATEQHDFWFVFQQKGVAPLARMKRFLRGSLWSCGEVSVDEGIRRYKYYLAKHGEQEPWVDDAEPEDFQDDQFPAYMTEI